MYSIRRFGVVRTATIVAVMYVIIIAIFFIPIALIGGLVGVGIGGGASQGGAALFGILIIGVIVALFYGAVGWVFTAIACLLYNAAAGMVGGIHIQLEAVAPKQAQAVPGAWGAPAVPSTPIAAPIAAPTAPSVEPPSLEPPVG